MRDNLVVLGAHGLGAGANLFLTALLIRVAGDATYGAYILITSLGILIMGVSSLGVGFRYKRALPALAHDAPGRRQQFYPQFYFQLAMVLILAGAAWFAARPLEQGLLEPGVPLAPWIVPAFVIAYFGFTQASDYFRYSLRVDRAMALSIVQPYSQILVTWIIWRTIGSVALPAAFFAFTLTTVVASAPFGWRMLREMGVAKPEFSWLRLRDDMVLGFPLTLAFFADYALSSTARYVVAVKLDLEAVAWFSAAYTVANMVSLFPRVTATVLPPLMARAVDAERPADAQQTLTWSIRLFLMLAIPFVVGSCVLGREVLAMIGSPTLAERAWTLIPILGLGTLFYGLNVILNNVLFVILKTGLLFRITLLTAFLNLVLCLFGLEAWADVRVVALAQLASYAAAFFFFRQQVHALWPLHFDWAFIKRAIASALAMAAVVFAVKILMVGPGRDRLTLAAGLALGVPVYFLSLFALNALEPEMRLLRNWRGSKSSPSSTT